jgi:hypothetical protein
LPGSVLSVAVALLDEKTGVVQLPPEAGCVVPVGVDGSVVVVVVVVGSVVVVVVVVVVVGSVVVDVVSAGDGWVIIVVGDRGAFLAQLTVSVLAWTFVFVSAFGHVITNEMPGLNGVLLVKA